MIPRRTFIKQLGIWTSLVSHPMVLAQSLPIGPMASDLLTSAGFRHVDAVSRWYLTAAKNTETGKFQGLVFDPYSGAGRRCELPERPHGACRHPLNGDCLFIGRRPSDTFWLMRFETADVSKPDGKLVGPHSPVAIKAKRGRHFSGHACYSPDGKYLYTTENHYEVGAGVIGVRDVANGYQQIAEWNSGGIGPHELVWQAASGMLMIANGGILTHPGQPRKKLNLNTMQPNLTVLNPVTGECQSRSELPASFLSIRHLATVPGQESVYVACQWEGDPWEREPLVYRWQPQGWAAVDAPDDWDPFRNYVGSITSTLSGRFVAFTSPKGGKLGVVDVATNQLVQTFDFDDVCGLAAGVNENQFIASTGKGELYQLEWEAKTEQFGARNITHASFKNSLFDNHLYS